MLIFAPILSLGLNNQKMDADTLIKIDTTARLKSPAFPDSSVIMLPDWNYSNDSLSFFSSKSWLDKAKMSYSKSFGYNSLRHEGITRTDKILPESILVILLFLEILLVAFLIKSGFSYINNSIKNIVSFNAERDYSKDPGRKSLGPSRYLWGLSILIFALIAPVIVHVDNGSKDYNLDVWLFIRFFLYVMAYFLLKSFICLIIGNVFFTKIQTQRWMSGNRAILSFYALILSPVLVGIGIGVPMTSFFIFSWVIGSLIIAKSWLLMKSVKIFSIRRGDILYLILYLCALEILPILLFYKGLFLL